MNIVSTPVDLDADDYGMGNVLITDAQLLIRPAVKGQYHRYARHDSGHAYQVLNLANDMGLYTWHIVTDADPDTAHRLLDDVIRCYVDFCSMELWCVARVFYRIGDQLARTEEYGQEPSSYDMRFIVHCQVTDPQPLVAQLLQEITPEEPLVIVHADASPDGYRADRFTVDDVSEEPQPV